MALEGELVLITGTGSGLGLALSQIYLAAGYSVLAVSRRSMTGILEHRNLYGLQLDVAAVGAEGQLREAVEEVMSNGLTLSACIFNAGILRSVQVEKLMPETMSEVMETNFFSIARCVQQLVPILREQGFGSILAVSSLSAHMGLAEDGIYAASKAALERMFESLSLELDGDNIKVGLVVPSVFASGLSKSLAATKPDAAAGEVVERLAERVLQFVERGMPGFRLPGDDRAESILSQLYACDGASRMRLALSWSGI